MGEWIDYLYMYFFQPPIGTYRVFQLLPMSTFPSAIRLRELSTIIRRPCSLRHRLIHNTLGRPSLRYSRSEMPDVSQSTTDPKVASQEPQNAPAAQSQQSQGEGGSSKQQIEALFRAARGRNAKLTPEEIQKHYPWSRSLSPPVLPARLLVSRGH